MKTIKIERRKPRVTKPADLYPRQIRVSETRHQRIRELAAQSGVPLAHLVETLLAAACEEVQIVD